jgi:Zn-dependent peptidase ImmA (M78 family)/transcriptional regulator with XRE-family HTH domain
MTGPVDHVAALKELGRRLAARRAEARLDVERLAARAIVPPHLIERFERGEGGLATGALTRISSVLGIPVAGLILVSAPEVKAAAEPSALLFARGITSLGAADAQKLDESTHRARAFIEVGRMLAIEDLCEYFTPSPAPAKDAHKEGYACAREVRSLMPEYQGQPLRNLARLIEDRFNILVVHHSFENSSILGATSRTGQARIILINAGVKHEAEVRFTLAHELGHQLKDLKENGTAVDENGEESAVFSLETPPAEKRAKAFAAMLLAPEDALKEYLGPPRSLGHEMIPARQLVRKARHHFGMGFEAMAWHLFNMGYLQYRETVVALLKAPDQDEVVGFETGSQLDGLERRAQAALYGDLISEARYRELLGLPYDALLS